MSNLHLRFISKRTYTLLTDRNHLIALGDAEILRICTDIYAPVWKDQENPGIIQSKAIQTDVTYQEKFYDQNGDRVFAVMYYDGNKFLAWELIEDAFIRKSVFEQYRIKSYTTGYIAGTVHPMNGHISASTMTGYQLWQTLLYENDTQCQIQDNLQ